MNPDVSYGTVVGPPALLVPGACVAGFHPQDCLLRWVVAPTSRRFLNARFPAPGHLGAYIFRPFAAFRLPVEATGAWRRLSVLQVPHVSEGYWTQTAVEPVAGMASLLSAPPLLESQMREGVEGVLFVRFSRYFGGFAVHGMAVVYRD